MELRIPFHLKSLECAHLLETNGYFFRNYKWLVVFIFCSILQRNGWNYDFFENSIFCFDLLVGLLKLLFYTTPPLVFLLAVYRCFVYYWPWYLLSLYDLTLFQIREVLWYHPKLPKLPFLVQMSATSVCTWTFKSIEGTLINGLFHETYSKVPFSEADKDLFVLFFRQLMQYHLNK